jgi:hypothetical protein
MVNYVYLSLAIAAGMVLEALILGAIGASFRYWQWRRSEPQRKLMEEKMRQYLEQASKAASEQDDLPLFPTSGSVN